MKAFHVDRFRLSFSIIVREYCCVPTQLFSYSKLYSSGKLKAAQWIMGSLGQTCDQVCDAAGGTCDVNMLATINSESAAQSAFALAGQSCVADALPNYEARSYLVPYLSPQNKCVYMNSGASVSCDSLHSTSWQTPLCYCDVLGKFSNDNNSILL